jgi:hypothetical protein
MNAKILIVAVLFFLICFGCQNSDAVKVRNWPSEEIDKDRYKQTVKCIQIKVCYPNNPQTHVITNKYKMWIVEENGVYKVVSYKDDGKVDLIGTPIGELKELTNSPNYDLVLFSANVPILIIDSFHGFIDSNGKMSYFRQFKHIYI